MIQAVKHGFTDNRYITDMNIIFLVITLRNDKSVLIEPIKKL